MTKKVSLKPGGVPFLIVAYLNAMFPASYTPSTLALEINLDVVTVRKACQRLLRNGHIQRPNYERRNWYQAIPSPKNISQLEEPPVKLHDLTFYAQVDPKIKCPETRGTPPSLYTHEDTLNKEPLKQLYWEVNRHLYRVTFQFSKNSVTVHFLADKRPLDELEFISLNTWLYGILQGLGVNVHIIDLDLVKAEMSRDYELITITPKMLLIRDLQNRAWLRIYQKYRNLTRIEIGTTWKGDKTIYQLFKDFGKQKGPERYTVPGPEFG